MDKRINYIDFLKFIGLTCIILAHVNPPDWIMMLRSFDVPLMVIISSFLCIKSYERKKQRKETLGKYYVNRVLRLVTPTWLFLLIFFVGEYCAGGGYTHSLNYYVASFLLTQYGIGYVWIILIYLFSALFVPVFSKYRSYKVCLILLLLYILYEIAYYFKVGVDNKLVDTLFYYMIPYGGVLTFLGCNYSRFSSRTKYFVMIASATLFLYWGIYYFIATGSIQNVNIDKYPPRVYYLSFGISISFLLMMVCEKHELRVYSNRFIRFVSSHSMWIYLWHILALYIYNYLSLPAIWYIELPAVYFLSLGIVFLQDLVVTRLERKRSFVLLRYLKG